MSLPHQMTKAILRKMAQDGDYKISSHAFKRMGEREIVDDDLIKCFAQADLSDILETQYHGPDPKVLGQSEDANGEEFFAVVAVAVIPVVVTVFRSLENAQDYVRTARKG